MKKRLEKIMAMLFAAVLLLANTSCNDDDPEAPTPSEPLSTSMMGEWLLASSDASQWTTYEFKSASLHSQTFTNGFRNEWVGHYSINEEAKVISGMVQDSRGSVTYIDWRLNDVKALQMDIDIYGNSGNTLIGSSSLNKILSTQEMEEGASLKPDYQRYTGSGSVSGFRSIDESIVKVDDASGELTAVGEGTTFICFNTAGGTAALRVNVAASELVLSNNILGTWITEIEDQMWERDTFGEDGYFFAEWSRKIIYPTDGETAQGTYTVNDKTNIIAVRATTPYGQVLNSEYRIKSFDRFSFKVDAYSGNVFSGSLYYQRRLSSETIAPGATLQPNYQSLVGNTEIRGYKSHDNSVAAVSPTGEITAVNNGTTYIDVDTPQGVGVVEVIVKDDSIPYDFQSLLGQPVSAVHEMFGSDPYLEDNEYVAYMNVNPDISMVGVLLDSWAGLVKGVTVSFKSSVSVNGVTAALDRNYIPYMSQTTETLKAYMDASTVADATVGVTWDTSKLTLTYVSLVKSLFRDYSVLLGMTKSQVLDKMDMEPYSSDETSQVFFMYDNKGVAIVGAYYTDFVNVFDKAYLVNVKLDDTISAEQAMAYLGKTYNYYPEYSTDTDKMFVSDDMSLIIDFSPADKWVLYKKNTGAQSVKAQVAAMKKARKKVRSSINK